MAYKLIQCLGLLSLLLQIVGFASPGWLVLSYPTFDVGHGLWYVRYCGDVTCSGVGDDGDVLECSRPKTNCDVVAYNEHLDKVENISRIIRRKDLTHSVLVGYLVEATLAVILCLAGFVSLNIAASVAIKHKEGSTRSWIFIQAAACLIVSGVLMLIPVCKFAILIEDIKTYPGKDETTSIAYSLVLAGVGGSMAFICALCLLCAYAEYHFRDSGFEEENRRNMANRILDRHMTPGHYAKDLNM